jgi:GNAT superfamily N-acetyltransferase
VKECYWLKVEGHLVVADLLLTDEGGLITRLNTPAILRGQGYASLLLEEICEDADREEVELCLQVMSSGDLTNAQLYKWYKRFGFRSVSPTLKYAMRRIPNSTLGPKV